MEGFEFEHQAVFRIGGEVHYKREYRILHEGNSSRREGVYGALDDVILELPGLKQLYLFQAKQAKNDSKQIGFHDTLGFGNFGLCKYILSYMKYKSSEPAKNDGLPTLMSIWTSRDLHKTLKTFMEPFPVSDDLLKFEGIEKYWFEDWKKLFIAQMAKQFEECVAINVRKEELNKKKYVQYIFKQLIREVVELVKEQTDSSEFKTKPKFRQAFLRNENLSKDATLLRDIMIQNKNIQLLDTSSADLDFDIEAFEHNFGVYPESTTDKDGQFTLKLHDEEKKQHVEVNEEDLAWFFKRFVFFVKIPKGDKMVASLNKLYKGNFYEPLFKKKLITETGWKSRTDVESIIQTVQFITDPSPAHFYKGVEFSVPEELNKTVELFCKNNSSETMTIEAPVNINWTVGRVLEAVSIAIYPKKCKIVKDEDVKKFNKMIERIIRSELEIVITVNLKQTLNRYDGLREIAIVTPGSREIKGSFFEDNITFNDVKEVHYEQLLYNIIIDGNEIALSESCVKSAINDQIENLVELSNLDKLEVKSDLRDYDRNSYIQRGLCRNYEPVPYSVLISERPGSVSVIYGECLEGKTTELLRIAEEARTSSNDTVFLYYHAQNIADKIRSREVKSFDDLPKLLQIGHMERSVFTEDVVLECLKQYKITLLVDELDKLNETSQDDVIEFVKSALGSKYCSVIIATRTYAQAKLKSAFENATIYTLGKIPQNQLSEQFLFNGRFPIDKTHMPQTLNVDESSTVSLSPQFWKILGTTYRDNVSISSTTTLIQLAGAFYENLIEYQFEKIIDKKKLASVDEEHLKEYFYSKHMTLAHQLFVPWDKTNDYGNITRYGLIIREGGQCAFINNSIMLFFLTRYYVTNDVMQINEKISTLVDFFRKMLSLNMKAQYMSIKFLDHHLGKSGYYNPNEMKEAFKICFKIFDYYVVYFSTIALRTRSFKILQLTYQCIEELIFFDYNDDEVLTGAYRILFGMIEPINRPPI